MSAPSETSVKVLIEFKKGEAATTSRQVEEDSSENTSTLEENPTIVLSEFAQTSETEEPAPSVTSTIIISESVQTSDIEILPSITSTIVIADSTDNSEEVEVVNPVTNSDSSSETPSQTTSSSDNSDKDTEQSTVIISSSEENIIHQPPPAPLIETEEQKYQRYKRKRLLQWIQCQQKIQRSQNFV